MTTIVLPDPNPTALHLDGPAAELMGFLAGLFVRGVEGAPLSRRNAALLLWVSQHLSDLDGVEYGRFTVDLHPGQIQPDLLQKYERVKLP